MKQGLKKLFLKKKKQILLIISEHWRKKLNYMKIGFFLSRKKNNFFFNLKKKVKKIEKEKLEIESQKNAFRINYENLQREYDLLKYFNIFQMLQLKKYIFKGRDKANKY